jgi:hypothetical protein
MKEDHPEPGEDQPHDRHHLDEREPELELAEHPDRQQIGAIEHGESRERRQPLRHAGQPEAHVDTDGGDLRHHGRNPGEPVGPAGHEAREGSAELVRVGRERAGHRAVGEQLPERAHDEEDRDPADRIGEQQPGARVVDRPGRSEEQSDTDGSAEGDQLDVPVVEIACEIGIGPRHGDSLKTRQCGGDGGPSRA